MISREDVEHVAALARLGLTDQEIDLMQGQLNRILEAVGQLQAVDTSSVGPLLPRRGQCVPLSHARLRS